MAGANGSWRSIKSGKYKGGYVYAKKGESTQSAMKRNTVFKRMSG